MTVVDRSARTADDVLRAAEQLAPTIADRADEIEAARRVPPDLLGDLVSAGCFRILLPSTHGGAAADLPSAMRILETLATADASVAWIVSIGAGSWLDLVGLPRASFDDIVGTAPEVIGAGAFAPSGTAVPVDGGYRVTGRWAFASGCEHATWIYGNCIVPGDGSDEDAPPQMRVAVFAPSEVTIEDTWHVSGLRGSGSHHVHVDDVLVPVDRTLDPMADPPCLDEPIVRVPLLSAIALPMASIALGVARAALDDIVALATGKMPLLASGSLSANPLFQHELAAAETELHAARCLLYELAEAAWATAVSGAQPAMLDRARERAAAAWVTSRSAAVVEMAYRSGGGTTLYSDNSLQRRFRDAHALTQHFLVKADTLTTAGAVLAGHDPGVPLF